MTTFICGYWKINDNKKHCYEDHYKKLIPKTLNLLKDCNIVFFYDDDEIISYIKKNIKTNNVIYKKISIESLETYKLSNDYLQTCKLQDNNYLKSIDVKNDDKIGREKGLIHYSREYLKSGESSFKKVFTVWTSKLFLVNDIIDQNPFNTNYFAWIDISASRTNVNSKYYTQYYLPNKLFHFSFSRMRYYGNRIPLNAFFLIAHKNIWKEIIPLYRKQLEISKNSKYAHDEETMLYLIFKEHNELFLPIEKYKKDNLNISLKYGACFIHIPKCGGTTIEKMLFNENNNRNGKFPQSNHSTILEFKNFYSFYIFSFVRNPYTRIISIFNYYMNNGNGSDYDKNIISDKINTTLNNFLDLYTHKTIPHLHTQFYYLKNSNHIDYIAKYENYNVELTKIMNLLNYKNENMNIIHSRKTEKKNYLVTPEFINKVNQIYIDDFKNYNYEMITLDNPIYYDELLKKI